MAFDAHKNLAISAVVTAPTPATSGTSLAVTAGEGGRFPAVPFNATVWPANAMPTPANAELVRVTARSTDTFTAIVRAQEGTTARVITAGDLIAASITAKTLTDLETQAALLAAANTFTADQTLTTPARLVFKDTGAAVDSRVIDLLPGAPGFHLRALNDAQTVVQSTPLQLTRTGDAYIGRNVHEKGLTVPIGHWTPLTFTAGLLTASAGTWTLPGAPSTFQIMRIGNTVWIAAHLASGTLSAAPVELGLAIPGVTFVGGIGQAFISFNATASAGWANTIAGTNKISLYRDILGTAWTAGTAHVSGVFMGVVA